MPDPNHLTKRGGTAGTTRPPAGSSPPGNPRMVARRGLRWRLLAHHQDGPGETFNLDVKPSQRLAFDELVVSPWLHIEQMDDGLWHATIGPLHMDVSVDETGVTCLTGWWDTPKAPLLDVPKGVAGA